MDLCGEIKKIPFKIAYRSAGFSEEETSKLVNNDANRELIDEGLNILTAGLSGSDDLAKYAGDSSSATAQLPKDYLNLVNFCFSPKIGLSLPKTDVERFSRAAEDFALFGKLEAEDEEIVYGRSSPAPSTSSKSDTNSPNSPMVQQSVWRNSGSQVRYFSRATPSNVMPFYTHQVLMPIFYKPVNVMYPVVPHFAPRFPPFLPRLAYKDWRLSYRQTVPPANPSEMIRSQASHSSYRNCPSSSGEKTAAKIAEKTEEAAKDDEDESDSE